jgi:hypothetical protein
MEQRQRNSSGAEGDAGGGALEPARRTALLRRSGCRRPTQGLSGNSSHELKGVPEPVTLFRLVRATPLRDKRRPGRAGTLYRHKGGRLRLMEARDVPSMFAATWRDHGCRGARIVARSFWLMASPPR